MPKAALPALLSAHISGDSALSSLMAKAERLRRLQEVLLDRLPPELARHCRVANVRGDAAVLHVANNAVAAKLRMLTPRVLEGFQKVFPDVKAVKLEVQFHVAAPTGRLRRPPPVLPPAAPLEALADSLPASPLQDAVRSLAEKARRG